MEIHKPKAPHSWGELAREIAVIVTGILIALGLEEFVRANHERELAREARAAIRQEVQDNLNAMLVREVTLNCVGRRLDEVGALLEKTREGELAPRPSWIGQPAVSVIQTQRWEAATSAGRTSLLSEKEQGQFARVYALMRNFSRDESDEQAAWAQLRALESWQGPIGPGGRVHFSEALQKARYEFWTLPWSIRLTREFTEALGVRARPVHSISDRYKGIPHAVCLPITTSRDQALKLLADNPFGQPR